MLRRTGELSYEILLKPGVHQEVHMDQLKLYVADTMEGKGVDLFHDKGSYKTMNSRLNEWNIDIILKHRRGKEGKGALLVKWEDTDESDATWEPGSN